MFDTLPGPYRCRRCAPVMLSDGVARLMCFGVAVARLMYLALPLRAYRLLLRGLVLCGLVVSS